MSNTAMWENLGKTFGQPIGQGIQTGMDQQRLGPLLNQTAPLTTQQITGAMAQTDPGKALAYKVEQQKLSQQNEIEEEDKRAKLYLEMFKDEKNPQVRKSILESSKKALGSSQRYGSFVNSLDVSDKGNVVLLGSGAEISKLSPALQGKLNPTAIYNIEIDDKGNPVDPEQLKNPGSLQSKPVFYQGRNTNLNYSSLTGKHYDSQGNPIDEKLIQSEKTAGELKQGTGSETEMTKDEKFYIGMLLKPLQARSGGLGLQDSKVNQAIDLRVMADQFYDPKTGAYNVPPAQYSELALGLARLISPTGVVGVELMKELKQATTREGLAKVLIHLGADPKKIGSSTQSVMKLLVDSIDRQGYTAEKLRENYMTGIKKMAPKSLSPQRLQELNNSQVGSSFSDYIKTNNPTNIKNFGTEQEAEKANLPKGTIISINGRKARVK